MASIRAEHAPDRCLRSFMRIRDHRLRVTRTTVRQAPEEARTERLHLRRTDIQPASGTSRLATDMANHRRAVQERLHEVIAISLHSLETCDVPNSDNLIAARHPLRRDAAGRRLLDNPNSAFLTFSETFRACRNSWK